MPKNVLLFERLIYGSLFIGLLNIILDGPRQLESPEVQAAGGAPFFYGVAFITLAVFVLLVWLIARRGKNWARWLFAVLFLVGLLPAYQNFLKLLEAHLLVASLCVVQLVLQLAALYFIFTGDARPWFAKTRT
ncbi:MAG: hypothetical protein ABI457_07610 [Hyphomicrobium sp.]